MSPAWERDAVFLGPPHGSASVPASFHNNQVSRPCAAVFSPGVPTQVNSVGFTCCALGHLLFDAAVFAVPLGALLVHAAGEERRRGRRGHGCSRREDSQPAEGRREEPRGDNQEQNTGARDIRARCCLSPRYVASQTALYISPQNCLLPLRLLRLLLPTCALRLFFRSNKEAPPTQTPPPPGIDLHVSPKFFFFFFSPFSLRS